MSFNNGIKIEDKYTSLTFDIFPNLRDCVEEQAITKEEESSDGTTLYDEQNTEQVSNLSSTGVLVLDENGYAQLDTARVKNESKYVDGDGFYYIPAGTLELVVSLNPYGLIENEADNSRKKH